MERRAKWSSPEDLIREGYITDRAAMFIQAAVAARLNILICGPPNSGKKLLMHAMSLFVPHYEQIAVIENREELMIAQRADQISRFLRGEAEGAGAIVQCQTDDRGYITRIDREPIVDNSGSRGIVMRKLWSRAISSHPDRKEIGSQ